MIVREFHYGWPVTPHTDRGMLLSEAITRVGNLFPDGNPILKRVVDEGASLEYVFGVEVPSMDFDPLAECIA
jgi:hypothetical protein